MKKFSCLALLLSLSLFTIGCEKPKDKPKDTPPAGDGKMEPKADAGKPADAPDKPADDEPKADDAK